VQEDGQIIGEKGGKCVKGRAFLCGLCDLLGFVVIRLDA
jgi:hypothetical protein